MNDVRIWKSLSLRKEYGPFLFLGIVMMLMHMRYEFGSDDLFFGTQPFTVDFFVNRYMTWSSRIFTEAILVTVAHLPMMVWRVLDVAVVCTLCYTLRYLFVPERYKKFGAWTIVFLFLLYPFGDLSNAGWCATTTNYLWPMLFTVLACIPLKKMWQQKPFSRKEAGLYLLMMLLAEDLELYWLILGMMYGFGYLLLKGKKRYAVFWIVQAGITVLSLAKILLCPGNKLRYVAEIGNWFPDYEKITIFDKLNLGLTSTVGHFIVRSDVIMIIFLSLMGYLMFHKTRNMVYRGIAIFPLGAKLLGMLAFNLGWYAWIPMRKGNPVSAVNADSVLGYWPLLVSVLFLACIMMSLYLIFGHNRKGLFMIWLFITGEATSFVMIFSPTVFASMDRSYFPYHIAIILLTLQCAVQWKEMKCPGITKSRDC